MNQNLKINKTNAIEFYRMSYEGHQQIPEFTENGNSMY